MSHENLEDLTEKLRRCSNQQKARSRTTFLDQTENLEKGQMERMDLCFS
ncbi:hypothetical protein RJ641_016815 [Dillenia turbinata]|uniref:Uncharacterized protein n=1 Tax=Dillenia turbinata TaxID=194707 RepID=A0AAN8Z2J8_9MAGN